MTTLTERTTDLQPLSALLAGGQPPPLPVHLLPGIIGPPGVTVWAGPGAAGKGLTWAYVAACISRGMPLPPTLWNDPLIDWDTVATPGKVIVVSPEDSLADIFWRVEAAGGDKDRIYVLNEVPTPDGDVMSRSQFSLPRDIDYLREEITKIGDVRLVVLDNLMALATSTVSFNQQYRLAIGNPLEELGEKLGVRIILVNHFTKGVPKGGLSSMKNLGDYIFGSAGVIQASRLTAVFMPEGGTVSISTYKSNGVRAKIPLRYAIEGEGEHVRLLWEQPPLSANDPLLVDRLVDGIVRELEDATRPVTEQELATYLRIPYPMVQQALAIAESRGLLKQWRGAWSVPDPGELPAIEPAAGLPDFALDQWETDGGAVLLEVR